MENRIRGQNIYRISGIGKKSGAIDHKELDENHIAGAQKAIDLWEEFLSKTLTKQYRTQSP